jgi:NitT/TauT family transport system permease protein
MMAKPGKGGLPFPAAIDFNRPPQIGGRNDGMAVGQDREAMTTPGGSRVAATLRARGDQVAVLAVLIVIWAGLSAILGAYWVGTPWGTIRRFVLGVLDGNLLVHSAYTLGEAVAGFVIGGVSAVLIPFAIRRMPAVVAIFDPFMVGGYGAPKLALAPLFILWFGIGVGSKVALVACTVFFIVYFATLAGVRSLDPRLVQMAQVAGANERTVLRHIVFPGAVPHIFTGLRIAMPYSIGGAVIVELLSANRGLGYLIERDATNYDTTGIFVALAATACIVFIGNGLVSAAERALLRWRPPAEAGLQAVAGT